MLLFVGALAKDVPECFCAIRDTGVSMQYRLFDNKSTAVLEAEFEHLIDKYTKFVFEHQNTSLPIMSAESWKAATLVTTFPMKIPPIVSTIKVNFFNKFFYFSYIPKLGPARGYMLRFTDSEGSGLGKDVLFKHYTLSHFKGNQFEVDLCRNFVIYVNKFLFKHHNAKSRIAFSEALANVESKSCLPYNFVTVRPLSKSYEKKDALLADMYYRNDNGRRAVLPTRRMGVQLNYAKPWLQNINQTKLDALRDPSKTLSTSTSLKDTPKPGKSTSKPNDSKVISTPSKTMDSKKTTTVVKEEPSRVSGKGVAKKEIPVVSIDLTTSVVKEDDKVVSRVERERPEDETEVEINEEQTTIDPMDEELLEEDGSNLTLQEINEHNAGIVKEFANEEEEVEDEEDPETLEREKLERLAIEEKNLKKEELELAKKEAVKDVNFVYHEEADKQLTLLKEDKLLLSKPSSKVKVMDGLSSTFNTKLVDHDERTDRMEQFVASRMKWGNDMDQPTALYLWSLERGKLQQAVFFIMSLTKFLLEKNQNKFQNPKFDLIVYSDLSMYITLGKTCIPELELKKILAYIQYEKTMVETEEKMTTVGVTIAVKKVTKIKNGEVTSVTYNGRSSVRSDSQLSGETVNITKSVSTKLQKLHLLI